MDRSSDFGDNRVKFRYHKHSHDNELGSVHGLSGHLWYLLCYPKRHKHSLQLLYPKGRLFLLHHPADSSHKVAILLPVLSNNFKSLPACFATFIAIFHPPGPCRPPPLGSFLLNFLKLF